MVIENRNLEEHSKCEYFDFDGVPIRVVYKEDRELPIGAHIVDPETGKLIKRANLISPTEVDPHCEKISEQVFYELCEERIRQNSSRKKS